ncbi:phosphoglycerate dehydrogenase [Tessaracoccus terricola]
MKILLPDSVPLSPELPDGVTAVTYAVAEPIPPEHLDAEVLVVWTNSQQHLDATAAAMPGLRLVQGLMAGPDTLLRAGFADGTVLANGVGLHDATVAEHTLALLLGLVRRLPQSREAQSRHEWSSELGGPQPLHPDGPITTLLGAKVLVWGFGSIAKRLAPLLTALGAEVRGIARSAGTRAGYDVVAESDLLQVLPGADVLVSILPDTPETRNALGASELEAMAEHAYFVNVGRGTTVDEDALVAALRQGSIAGAALDVTAVEPLPAESPLWDAPNVLLTPHAAGGRPVEPDALISHNVAALHTGGSLKNIVER